MARLSRLAVLCLVVLPVAVRAEERAFREGRYEKGELRYVGNLPVLTAAGTPEEIGRQKAMLTGDVAKQLAAYPKKLLAAIEGKDTWATAVQRAEMLAPQFPADHRAEIRAFGEKAGVARELGLVSNTLVDTYRGGFGCSSLMVDADRSATGQPLFGRNLDFYTMGLLARYSLVSVYRPEGKHAFATIGFPGLIGCLSGMNDAGLAVAVHEVFLSRDDAPMFNPKGVPYTLAFRRVLEECTTVQEAEKLLRGLERTTKLNLAMCDRRQSMVLEMTPRTVASRGSADGICACTNHFRTDGLAVVPFCPRYRKLIQSRAIEKLDVADVARKLHEVNLGRLTIQTMVFEPAPLVLHLAIGECPASAHPLQRLELAPLFAAAERAPPQE